MRFSAVLASLGCLSSSFAVPRGARLVDQDDQLSKRGSDNSSNWRYLNDKSQPYKVDSLPDVNFDVGEMYAGVMPIDSSDESRGLFYVFQPTVGEPVDEVVIWLNGGPGCSSLEGFLQENGRFLWEPGTFRPIHNPYSWVNLTNMLWVEFPVGVGFSIGEVTASTQEEVAQDFIGFFRNFQETFGISNHKIYITGEPYAGRFVPYIGSAMIDEDDKEHFDLAGSLIVDGGLGDYEHGNQVSAYDFIDKNHLLLNINETTRSTLRGIHEKCGYANYTETYLTFPPPAHQPSVFFNTSDPSNASCDVYNSAVVAIVAINPCFNFNSINQRCPLLWDVIGYPSILIYSPPGADSYFNRSDVRSAIHAPDSVSWPYKCTKKPVFTGGNNGPQNNGDLSATPIQHVLPRVIDHTNRVLITNGDYDMAILTNTSLLAIQNMTWNGQLGFQSEPSTSLIVDLPELEYLDVYAANGVPSGAGPQGVMGISHSERGLAWVQTFQAGHMGPQYQKRVSYKQLQWVLGRVKDL